jgi:hypothetical protein
MVNRGLRPEQQHRGEMSQLLLQQHDLRLQRGQLLLQVGF